MLLRYITNFGIKAPKSLFRFSSAVTKDAVNYYNVLEVDETATAQNISKAYAELVSPLSPEKDFERFKELNQAFVILTDNKTRDAYDSLLKVKKTYYLSAEQETVPSTRSYLSQRKHQKSQQLKKKLNIDQFGRYKGGLPQRRGDLRGNAQGQVGTFHRLRQVEQALDRFPEFHNIDAQKAESFKNFHANEREARTMKWPWFSFEVDYNFLNFRRFRKGYWPKIQFLIFFFYILPTFYYAFQRYQKQQLTQGLRQKSKTETKAHVTPAEGGATSQSH